MRLARTVLSVGSMVVLFGQSNAVGKEVMSAEQIFQNNKAAVVSVFTGSTFGSGFLVDDAGLILTSCEVLKDGSKNLRVKFGPNEVVEGKTIIRDQDHDLAIVRVNLKNISSFKSLAVPANGSQNATKVNDEVVYLALDKKTSEKTMTATTVRTIEKETMFLRGKSDPSGYGGPLLNLNGELIGVNTVVASVPGQPAAIPISYAEKDIEDAKLDITKLEAPSADLLPDIPQNSFNVSELLKDNPDLFKNRKQSDYNFSSPYFYVSVFTPVQGYFQLAKSWSKLTGTKKESEGLTLDESDLELSKEFFDTEKPVVTVMVMPKMRMTNGAKFLNAASLIGSTSALVAGSLVGVPMIAPGIYVKHKTIQKDFLDLSLVAADDKPVSQPIEAKRVPFEKESIALTGYKFPKLEDMAYLGIYTFDARCFETDKQLKLVVVGEGKGGKEGQSTIQFPEAVKKRIVEDFKPYWAATSSVAKSKDIKTEM